jgi:hypothetical protein
MNTETAITTVVEAKKALHATMETINQRMKWIDAELRYIPTINNCNNAWLEAVDIQRETENLKNMIDQLGAIVNKERNT